MKKYLLKLIARVLVVFVTIWNVKQRKNEYPLSDLALANIEALANGEVGDGSCNWATREVSNGWEAICIKGGPGFSCTCGDVKPYD